MITKDCQ